VSREEKRAKDFDRTVSQEGRAFWCSFEKKRNFKNL